MTFMVLIAFLFIVRLCESSLTREVIAAGIASGLATSTKYNAALVALPALLTIFSNGYVNDPRVRKRFSRAAIYACMLVGAFVVTSPYSVLDFREFLADVSYESRHMAEGHKVILGRGWIHHVTSSLRYGIGIPVLLTGFVGMVLILARDRRTGALVALFPLSYYLIIGSGYTVFARYIIPVIPFLCLTAAYAVMEAAEWVGVRMGRARWKPALAALTIVCLSWTSAQSVLSFNRIVSRTDSRVLAREWLEHYVPPGSTIAQLGTDGGHVLLFQHDSSELKYIRSDLTQPGARPDVVIVNTSPLIAQNPLSSRQVRILSRDYERAIVVNAVDLDEQANIYDWQDDFFVPLSGFKGIERPGPNVTIHIRRGALPHVARLPG
jgi:hypothetical protein